MSEIPKPVAIVPEKILPPDPESVTTYARAVEDMGYWAVTCKDHVVLGSTPDGNNGYTNELAFLEPFSLFNFMSAVTTDLKMISGVLVLPQRPTALVAKTAQMTSDLSKGRLILGVGVGSNATEFAAMGADMRHRGQRLEEQVVALRSLWGAPYSDYTSGKEHGKQVGINPRPKHDIPIWIGGWAPPVLERTARLADGWAPMGHPDDAKPHLPKLHALLEKYHRNPETFALFGAFATTRRGTQAPETIDQRAKDLTKWMELGATAVAYGRQETWLKPETAIKAHLEDLATHMSMFRKVTGYTPGN